MTNIKKQYGLELKELVNKKTPTEKIGEWAHEKYMDYPDSKDAKFLQLLLDLAKMELGEDFEISYEKLLNVAEQLIDGKEVELK